MVGERKFVISFSVQSSQELYYERKRKKKIYAYIARSVARELNPFDLWSGED